jgi:hypothetical protein
LFLIDTAHNVCRWPGFKLVTITVRNEVVIWEIGAQGFLESESIRSIGVFLTEVKRQFYAVTGMKWQPRYALSDDSAAEEGAIYKTFAPNMDESIIETNGMLEAFGGLIMGEMELSVLKLGEHT